MYATPEFMNKAKRSRRKRGHNYYTVIAGQIQISPPANGDVLRGRVFSEGPAADGGPRQQLAVREEPRRDHLRPVRRDIAFAKDDILFGIYDARFKESLDNITQDDQVTRWSGPALRVQVDGLIV